MAIAIDATSSVNSNSATSQTVSHTCTGSDRILFVAGLCPAGRTMTATYAGVSMTLIGSVGSQLTHLFYLIAPATGANNIVVSIDGAATYIYVSAASYTGARQSGVPDASTTNTNAGTTSLTTSVTTVADNCWTVLSARGEGDGALSAGAGTTERVSNDGFIQIFDSNAAITPAGSTSLITTGTSQPMNHVMASFAPFTAQTFIPQVMIF